MYHFDFEPFIIEKQKTYIKMVKEMFDDMEEKKTYEQGLEDAWKAARFIADLPFNEQTEVFGQGIHGYGAIVRHFTPAEAIAKIKAYEEKQNEIKVGDEIIDTRNRIYVITKVEESEYGFSGIDNRGRICCISKDVIKKTGKHYPQVEELLKAMNDNE